MRKLSWCLVQDLLQKNVSVERRTCVADEHYVPTLLAMHDLDSEVMHPPSLTDDAQDEVAPL